MQWFAGKVAVDSAVNGINTSTVADFKLPSSQTSACLITDSQRLVQASSNTLRGLWYI